MANKIQNFTKQLFFIFIKIFISPIINYLFIKNVEGIEKIPQKGPLILASNHQSYLDFICLISIIDRPITFLAAEKFYKSFFWMPIMLLSGQIKVDRTKKNKKKSIRKALEILKRNQVIGIFPQGTRSRTGKIEKFYNGVGILAIKSNSPIFPIGIKGAFQLWPPHKKFPLIKKNVEILIGNKIYYQKNSTDNNKKIYKKITKSVMKEICFLITKYKKKIHIFDLDNTLVKGQSQFHLINFLFKKKYIKIDTYIDILLWFIGYKLLINNNPEQGFNKAIKILKDKSNKEITSIINDFYKKSLKNKLNFKIIKILQAAQEKKHETILLSSAITPIAKVVSNKLNFNKFYSTKLKKVNGYYTGELDGPILYGKEKAKKIKQLYKNDNNEILVYADHYSDIHLFKLANKSFLINPSILKIIYFKLIKRLKILF